MTPERDAFFLTKKGKPVACPVPAGPLADSHTHLTSLVHLDPALAVARDAVAGADLIVTVVDPTEDARDPQSVLASLDGWLARAREILDGWGRRDVAVPRVRLLVGCHPHNARLFDRAARDAMRALLREPVCAGVGEIGLDYHYDLSPRDVQRAAFEEQLALAVALDAPMSLHVREAHDEAAVIMRRCGIPAAGAVMHCFDCDLATYRTFAAMGCHVGIGGAVTFAGMGQLREALQDPACRLETIVSETDAPYMAPVPLRGTACEPAYMAITCDYLAELRAASHGESREEVYRSLHDQATALFDAKAGFARELDAWDRRHRAGTPDEEPAGGATGVARLPVAPGEAPASTVAVLVGSPRAQGRCARLADAVADGVRAAGLDARVLALGDGDARELVAELDGCDGLAIVSPVYFAGPPAPLKAFFDALEFLWARRYQVGDYPPLPAGRRRPLTLLAVGEGGDPFGHEPLSVIAHSAMRMLDYELGRTVSCVGHDPAAFLDDAREAGRALAEEVRDRGALERPGVRASWLARLGALRARSSV